MLIFKFKLDKNILARLMISKSQIPTDFANYLWGKYKLSYILLQRNITSTGVDNNIILELQQQVFFNKCYDESYENLKRIEKLWNENQNKINLFIKKIFKKDFDLTCDAYIVSPNLNCGQNIGDNRFVWGHRNGKQDSNYDLVYLVHESLHSYFENTNLTHAIIENIADIELAKFFNNSEKTYPCHDFTKMLHVQILPFWNIYLNKKQEINIKNTEVFYNTSDFVKFQSTIKNLNIDDFVKFLDQLNLNELLDIQENYTIKIKKT